MDKTQKLVEKALVHLANSCDYANKQDNAGFNKIDAAFGHSLAEWVNSGKHLTPGQMVHAHKMVYKYKRQLPFDLPKPNNQPKPKNKKYIKLDGGTINIVFGGKPSTQDRQKLDELSYRRWNPNIKDLPWQTNASEAMKVWQLFGNRSDWHYTDEFKALVEKFEKDPNHKVTQATPTNQPKIDIKDGKIKFYFGGPPQPEHRKKLDMIERKWNPNAKGKPWESPLSVLAQVAELFSDCQFTQDFNVELQKAEMLKNMSRSAKSDFEIPGMKTSLLPFQKAGVEFLQIAEGRALLADEMGLGKTAQALAYLQLNTELRPAVMVVPASLKINWQREIKKFMTNPETVLIAYGRKPEPGVADNASMIIINYEILTGWLDYLISLKPQALIVDEAHKIKNPKAKRTKAVKKLSKLTQAFIPMTGTPMRNRPIELYTQLNMIAPTEWNNWWQYAKRYCGMYRNGYGVQMGQPENMDELHDRIKPYMIRRTKAEVMKELPPKIRTTIVLEFDKAERKLHDEFLREAMSVGASQAEHLAYIEKAKQAAARGKMKACIEWITEFLESGEKLVVFANHREITKMLYEHYQEQAAMIIGGVSQKARQDAVDRFQNDENVRLFVGNLDAAGVGLTLTAASNVAIVEFPWTPDTVDQAIDRCHRIGQVDSVTAWHLVAEDTIEEDIVELLQAKAEAIHAIMDNKHTKQEFSILGELNKIMHTRTENIRELA